MLRRDVFVQRYVDINNVKALQAEMAELEKYVDTALVDANNLLNYVNQNGLAGTSGMLDTQYVTSSIVNNTIHRDPAILDNGNGRAGSNKQFAIWGTSITTPTGNDATTMPWFDLTIDSTMSGELRINLPTSTNKNAAYMLLQKYLGPLIADSSQITQAQIDTNGFWGRKPIPGSNGTAGLIDANAVRLMYDSSQELFVMIFSL